jgi:glycosyltransferase involved in cell wall biosynthesis
MKVRVLPYQPHCFAFGGFEVQMVDAMRAVREAGIDIGPLDTWRRDADFDVLHVWGLGEMHYPAVYWAKKSGKRVVMTALLPALNTKTRLRNVATRMLGRNQTLRELVSLIDLLVVVNESQAATAKQLFGVPEKKIVEIPNIVDDRYYDANEPSTAFDPTLRNYIICVGNVTPRKNQLRLAQAALAAGVPLLLIGGVLVGEEAYGSALRRLIAQRGSVCWLDQGLPTGSSELVAAYRGSIGFALVSHDETQPISALEAMVSRKPLLLSDRPWARQHLYRGAALADPHSLSSIQAGIELLRESTDRPQQPADTLECCRSRRVGISYAQAYMRLT